MWHGPGFSMMLVVSSRRTPIRHTPYLRRHGRVTRSDRGRGQGWAYRCKYRWHRYQGEYWYQIDTFIAETFDIVRFPQCGVVVSLSNYIV